MLLFHLKTHLLDASIRGPLLVLRQFHTPFEQSSSFYPSSGDESEGESKEGIFKDKEGRKRVQAAESDRSLRERYQIAYKNRKTLD